MSKSNNEMVVTFLRNLPGEADEMADALLFASPSFIEDPQLEEILKSKTVTKCFDPAKPVMAIRYHKPEDLKLNFGEEWRVIVTQLRYYTMPMNDAHSSVTVATLEGGKLKLVKYLATLDGCIELFRLNGCTDCPKKGLECIEQNLHGRPWYFSFSYNRKYDDWAKGLCEEGNIMTRRDENEKCLLKFSKLTDLEQLLSTAKPAGATFVHPDKTRSGEFGMMTHPLRAARDHRFFKLNTETKEPKKGAAAEV